jgi:hypothetical protein
VIFLGLTVVTLFAATIVALTVDRDWKRQLGVALAGALVLGLAALASLALDCPGCTPEIGPWLAGFGLAGWLAGVGLAPLLRRRVRRRPRRSSLVAGVLLLALVASIVAYGRNSLNIVRWGCPSQAELDRVQSVEDVTSAFAEHDLALEAIPLPVWLPPSEPAYRGARAFRHVAPGATVYLVVCRQRCAISRFRFGEARRVGEQRWRIGLNSNNNVPIWVTEADPRSGARLLEAMSPALREVQPYIDSDSRCYIR